MKNIFIPSVIVNWWTFYLLKWGIVPRAELVIKTSPDPLKLSMDSLSLRKSIKVLRNFFRLVLKGEFSYRASDAVMTVYSQQKTKSKEYPFNLYVVEPIRNALDFNISFAESDHDKFFLVSINNNRLYVRKNNVSDMLIIKSTFIDREYDFLNEYIKDGQVVDVGVNIGDTAIMFARKGARRVLGFEPHPKFFAQATQNIYLNQLEDTVSLRPYGLGAKDITVTMKEDSNLGASGAFGLKESPLGDKITIKIAPISVLMGEMGTIDVLKLDCEGAEFDIIEALSTENLKRIRVIGMEYHRDPQPIIEKLEKNGFHVHKIKETNPQLGILKAVLN